MAEAAAIGTRARPLSGPLAETAAQVERLQAIDLLRGLVIVLMVLDHVRDFFSAGAFTADPLDPQTSNLALYLTRWVTHLCAPSFVFLAGASAFLKGARGRGRGELSRFLLTRGAWLVLLEMTLVNFGWTFGTIANFFQVIWAIGAGMMLLSAAIWLGPRLVLALGVVIVAGHNLLDPIDPPDLGTAAPLWNVVHETGLIEAGGRIVLLAYPALPWFGIMCLGYGLGAVFLKPAPERVRWLLGLGLAAITLFLLLRGLNLYGDPQPWTWQGDLGRTAMAFFNVNKYPPSLHFALVTLGVACLLLVVLERLRGAPAKILLAFGSVPLFVYVLHVYLAHLLQVLVGLALGFDLSIFVDTMLRPGGPPGWGFGLAAVYGVWIVVLLLLYPAARWFAGVKRRRRDWWLSYL